MDKKDLNDMTKDEVEAEISDLESRLEELNARKAEFSDDEPAEVRSTGGCMSVELG